MHKRAVLAFVDGLEVVSPNQNLGGDYKRPVSTQDTGPKVAVIGEGPGVLYFINHLITNNVRVTDLITSSSESGLEGITQRSFSEIFQVDQHMKDTHADYFVMAFFGHIIPKDIVAAYEDRFWNVHGSLLPEYAGLGDPVSIMMRDGKKEGGVTLHLVSEQIDRGKILRQEKFNLDYFGFDNYPEMSVAHNYLYKVIPIGARLVAQELNAAHRTGQTLETTSYRP